MKKMSLLTKIAVLSVVVLLVASSCSRTSDSIGPAVCPSDDFKVTSDLQVTDHLTSTDQINLLTSYANVAATFNESVSWRILFKGQTSGAVTEYSGKGSTISLKWYGEPSTEVFYSKGEKVTVSLFIACFEEAKSSKEVTVTTVTGLSQYGGVITNFEDSPVFSGFYHKDPLNPCDSTTIFPSNPIYEASPQGQNYFNFQCTLAPEAVEWYFGGTGFPITAFATVPSDPSEVYINVLAKGTTNSQAQFIFKEDVFGSLQNRKFLINVTPSWAMYSVKLSEIGIINVSKVKNLDLNLGASTERANSASVDLDMIILTKGKPLGQ